MYQVGLCVCACVCVCVCMMVQQIELLDHPTAIVALRLDDAVCNMKKNERLSKV